MIRTKIVGATAPALAVISILSILTGQSVAQGLSALLGTKSVEAKPFFAGGQLEGCTIEFTALAQDWVYKKGSYIAVAGAFGVMSVKDKLAVTLKVNLHDIDPVTMNFTPSPP